MARFRRKSCILLIALVLLVLVITVVLKVLTPEDSQFGGPFGVELFMERKNKKQRDNNNKLEQIKSNSSESHKDAELAAMLSRFPPPNYHLHAFYYSWYGNPKFDGKYIHWSHSQLPHWDIKVAQGYPQGKHNPPEDIGSNFYPFLGPYSSRDPVVIDDHMQQLRTAAIAPYLKQTPTRLLTSITVEIFQDCVGLIRVIAISWYPPHMNDDNGEPQDDLVYLLLEMAHKYNIKVAFHIEPYKGRDEVNMFSNVKYIIDKYGAHPAFFKYRTNNNKLLPLFYVYDSYLLNSDQWSKLLKHTHSESIRDTPYDAIFIALLVEEKHKRDILTSGFDGVYTYFATNGFSYGSTQRNWDSIKAFCENNNLLFIPSVGPGYIDTSIRPWNFQNTRNRIGGKYYENSLSAALQARPDFISITSFNEWHEGTQIEMAVPKTGQAVYLDYLPRKPEVYLAITRKWAVIFGTERQKWKE